MFIILLTVSLFTNCSTGKSSSTASPKSELTIAFGSCNRQLETQPIWKSVSKNKPDLWIWLGDIVYSDTEDMGKMKQDYDTQKHHPDYAPFAQETKILGIWDDHDYGINNGGKEYPKKDSSKLLLFDFLDLLQDSINMAHDGAYQSHTVSSGNLKIKILLLDTRYFRDTPHTTRASILGQKQWQWLVGELRENDADVHILASGVQILPEEHEFEKWANFGTDRTRLLQILDIMEVNNPILLSGDRHLAEVSLAPFPQSGRPIVEITSSGLTHAYTDFTSEANQYRIGQVYADKNFGLLKINKQANTVNYTIEIRTESNKKVASVDSDELSLILKQRGAKSKSGTSK